MCVSMTSPVWKGAHNTKKKLYTILCLLEIKAIHWFQHLNNVVSAQYIVKPPSIYNYSCFGLRLYQLLMSSRGASSHIFSKTT